MKGGHIVRSLGLCKLTNLDLFSHGHFGCDICCLIRLPHLSPPQVKKELFFPLGWLFPSFHRPRAFQEKLKLGFKGTAILAFQCQRRQGSSTS